MNVIVAIHNNKETKQKKHAENKARRFDMEDGDKEQKMRDNEWKTQTLNKGWKDGRQGLRASNIELRTKE